MIDDDDVTFAAVMMPGDGPGGAGCTVVLMLIGLIVVIALAVIANQNEEACEARTCNAGTARLLDGECVCTTEPE